MISNRSAPRPLPLSIWLGQAAAHRATIGEITVPMRARKSRRQKHPVYDFLHTYYSYTSVKTDSYGSIPEN